MISESEWPVQKWEDVGRTGSLKSFWLLLLCRQLAHELESREGEREREGNVNSKHALSRWRGRVHHPFHRPANAKMQSYCSSGIKREFALTEEACVGEIRLDTFNFLASQTVLLTLLSDWVNVPITFPKDQPLLLLCDQSSGGTYIYREGPKEPITMMDVGLAGSSHSEKRSLVSIWSFLFLLACQWRIFSGHQTPFFWASFNCCRSSGFSLCDCRSVCPSVRPSVRAKKIFLFSCFFRTPAKVISRDLPPLPSWPPPTLWLATVSSWSPSPPPPPPSTSL